MNLCPVTFKEAAAFVRQHHRHHLPPVGWKFRIGAEHDGQLVGVVTVGRPVARMLDNGRTLEVTRCCTDGTQNACSMLYGAAWRATKALGYIRLITYTLIEEPGTTLRAAGWKALHTTSGGSWERENRPLSIDRHPLGQKTLWEAV